MFNTTNYILFTLNLICIFANTTRHINVQISRGLNHCVKSQKKNMVLLKVIVEYNVYYNLTKP